MNPRGAKKFDEYWLLCQKCKAVIAPRSKRALFACKPVLLSSRMLPVTKCPVCGSTHLLRGELIERAPPGCYEAIRQRL
jgi:predicted RNA-binding Zn-ribbon protein involved in translation (DUF1610 family)